VAPLVSIVITYFDYADFLLQTVESLAQQTFRDFEVIVVDDCAPGSAAKTLLKGVELPITILRLDRNMGPAAACNAGIRASKGSFILPMDSDDLIANSYLEQTTRVLQNSDAIVSGVYTKVQMFGDLDLSYLPDCTVLNILAGQPCPTTFLYRREMFDELNGYKEHVYHHDNEFWLRALMQGREFARIDEPLYHYRKHDRGRSSAAREDELAELVREHRELFAEHLEYVAAAWEKRYWETRDDYARLDSAFRIMRSQYEHLHREFHSLLQVYEGLLAERSRYLTRQKLVERAMHFSKSLLNRRRSSSAEKTE
jgi:glycosyltransferase involved in cell wall biosynthesis